MQIKIWKGVKLAMKEIREEKNLVSSKDHEHVTRFYAWSRFTVGIKRVNGGSVTHEASQRERVAESPRQREYKYQHGRLRIKNFRSIRNSCD